jgi:hypothetical protein
MVSSIPETHVSRLDPDVSTFASHEPQRRPLDRVRWPAIIAGLFAALSVLAVLTVLGAAIGASTVDRNSDAGNFGLGSGIWGGISVLIAFAVGGYLAAHTSALRGTGQGALQGAMVWMVTIGLLVYLIAGLVGSAARTATDAATATASAAASNPQVTGAAADATQNGTTPPAAAQAGQAIQDASRNLQNSVGGEDVERAASTAAKGSWGTLIAMLLGLAAATIGGVMGARKNHHDDSVSVHTTRTTTTV